MQRIASLQNQLANEYNLRPIDVSIMVNPERNYYVTAWNTLKTPPEQLLNKDGKPLVIELKPLFHQLDMTSKLSELIKQNKEEIEYVKKGFARENGLKITALENKKRTEQEDIEYNKLKLEELYFNNSIAGLEKFNETFENGVLFDIVQNDVNIAEMEKNYVKLIKKAKELRKSENLDFYQKQSLNRAIQTYNEKSTTYIDKKYNSDYEKIGIYLKVEYTVRMVENYLKERKGF